MNKIIGIFIVFFSLNFWWFKKNVVSLHCERKGNTNKLKNNIMENMIENGVHYLSGIGQTTYHDEWNDEDVDVDLFCIDGVTYGAFVDPVDGYRSYGKITNVNYKCQYTFEPQKVIVENIDEKVFDDYGWKIIDAHKIVIKDAILDKVVLVVGTDYTDDYYPMAIFNYQPMNLYANVVRDIENKNKSI